ncbi:type II toxin-antitoxin system Phd/YefM family antitoxin [Streptomyces scopuliridis]|uniref:type II toxin-antitoxin system Phd/YefM family antitoxin n=1 Tax=Streptomyces scopuliridis TaxID=452529 RepID=UPI0035D88187
MGVSDARANMTEVIAEVRLLGHPVVLTRRDKPQAALVSIKFYEQAKADRAYLERLSKAFGKFTPEQQKAIGRDLIGPLLSDD